MARAATKMKRREFIKVGLGVAALASMPSRTWWVRSEPMVHVFPHWNWLGKERQNVPVWCFSNCAEGELGLNGRSMGKQTMPEFRHLQ